MEGGSTNADSDHSMTWEDFFGSTSDLTPTLIGIYDSLLEPTKKNIPEISRFDLNAKDTRNDPPLNIIEENSEKMVKTNNIDVKEVAIPTKIPGSVKLPGLGIKSSLYNVRTKTDSEQNGVTDSGVCNTNLTTSESSLLNKTLNRTVKTEIRYTESNAYDNLSPNVKRMISSATETSSALKFQKKMTGARASVRGHRSHIPLVGATSKITQSGVEILPSVEIYDQPTGIKVTTKAKVDDEKTPSKESPKKQHTFAKPDFKIEPQETYDVPTNNKPVFELNTDNKTTFEALSLPFIDQSIEINTAIQDREFDTKISPHKKSPEKFPPKIPVAIKEKTNSLTRNELSPAKSTKPEALGSIGNLKSLSSEKESSKSSTPTIEVSRPLSMSSIASSSSTSSSGVQNKGVNSAYLASIESLDDNSDADMISANGSNNFVNSAGLKGSVSIERRGDNMWREHYEEMSGLSQLERVCAEIVYTEHVYVRDLQEVVEGYLHVWKRDHIFSEEELAELFNNIEDIYNFNRSLCEELNSCRLDATCIARCFVNNTCGFSVYTSYCTGYPRTMERLAALASNSESAREFRERQVHLGHPLPLASYLLKPVQRILKYHLLLQNVVKQCASNETEYALLKMTGIAQHIDDMKRKHEHAVRVQEIQSLLYGWNGPDLTTYGELCAEGTFRVFGAKAMRHVFLFDKMLLVTKNREDGILAYKSHIMCNNMMLVEAIAGAALSFHVIPWDAPRGQVTLQASSPRHKREWTLLLKRVILENYNAVIPSHARQIVMELGQNKTDDDMLAEKSHNLITQASIRKQLSAPEYLEKRKLDRERRKSLENGLRGRLKKPNRKQPIVISTNEQVPRPECDCIQVSNEKGVDYTCDVCYVDLCSDCETDPTSKNKNVKNSPKHDTVKCPECDRALEYIDSGSAEQLERRSCKCTDFKSSQESFANLVKTRGYHSSDNISSYPDKTCDDSRTGKNQDRTCLKCVKINENIVTEPLGSSFRKSRCLEPEKHKQESNRSKSKEDTQRSKLSKIGTWRRKSEPGLPPNTHVVKKVNNYGGDKSETRGNEKIEFECRNCGSNKITRRDRSNEVGTDLDSYRKRNGNQNNVDIKMYNTKTVPKKISKIKKIRAKGGRGPDTTAKFYAELSDVSDNILHISESNDSLNVDRIDPVKSNVTISKDEDIDEETYKKLIEKTDSFKKNELEKVKYLNKEKVINEGSEVDDDSVMVRHDDEALESGEETEQPLEQIISQLLLQNREFQKLLKKQQQRSSSHRRHQRLLKSHSNPEEAATPPVPSNDKNNAMFRRQMSENLSHLPCENENETKEIINEEKIEEEDHIYETLRSDSRVDESLHCLDNKSKLIHHNNKIMRPKRLPSPPYSIKSIDAKNEGLRNNKESDYVYLSFDKLNNIGVEHEGIYEVPMKSPEKVVERPKTQTDYYVMIDKQGPLILDSNKTSTEAYDNIVEVCKRKKEVIQTGSTDYLPMSPESPNTPEIWLSRQKEHFNVSRDRKSGSLPRSFQVPSNAEENGVSTFKAKPSSNNKTYLNREGKVLSTDRPFTIASDQSEISYDDVENLMNESDILKFNKSNESDYSQNISQSTLELEKEIDRCYKKNFESVNLNGSQDKDLLLISQPNLNTSTASSCEVLSPDSDGKSKQPEIIHPENKIYKPTSNLRSLRNVLSRFKTKTIKSNDDFDCQEQSPKSDPKSPTNDKRSALNPRSYSKNLLQRFRSIIGDEQTDGHNLKPERTDEISYSASKTDIKVIITQSESSPTTSSITTEDALSKSVYEQTTLTESQTEKNKLEHLSNSCDNISPKSTLKNRPPFEKSISVTSSTTSSISVKSNTNSYQSLNKLPVYMQGSKHLGARIAQADYADPTKLQNEKPDTKHINVLINRISVRPDSLFSTSSFVTSSSEGVGQDGRKTVEPETKTLKNKFNSDNNGVQIHADESYYEKAFEKYITDDDVFRDSAVYSDQDELEDSNKIATIRKISKTVTKQTENNKKEIKKVIITKVTEPKSSINTDISHTVLSQSNDKIKQELVNKNKTRIAPPVPIKPKITNIPTTTALNARNINNKLASKLTEVKPTESTNTVKRNANLKQSFLRSESAPEDQDKTKSIIANCTANKDQDQVNNCKASVVDDSINRANTSHISVINNIHLKRLSFERASLDSATRKIKTVEVKNTNNTLKTTAKTVQERRMEIESLTKTQAKFSQLKKPTQIARPKIGPPKPVNDSEKISLVNPPDKNNIPSENSMIMTNHEISETDNDAKGSWVKTVVNKFQ